MYYSTNQLKSYMLFSSNCFVFWNFTEKKEFFAPENGGGVEEADPHPPSPLPPSVSMALSVSRAGP